MTKILDFRSISLSIIILFAIRVHCHDFNEFKKNLFSIRNFDFLNIVNDTVYWSQNRQCVNEFNAIENGFRNSEEWAFQILDAWGKFPPGILHQNFFDPGSFSECFHIQRNGRHYKTKYCIGQLLLESTAQKQEHLVGKPRLDMYRTGSSISMGMCLPSACSVEQLGSDVNRVVHRKLPGMTVRIPQDDCQSEETPSEYTIADFIAIGLLITVMVLMTLSTMYDLSYDALNRKKFEPFLMFSVYTNGLKIFTCESIQSSNVIQCIHGIRAIMAIWVITAHTYYIFYLIPSREHIEFIKYSQTYRSALIMAPIIVDSFFAITGLLTSIKLLKLLKKSGRLNICSLYFHRLLRLTPMLGVSILLTMTLARFVSSGPFWPFMMDHLIGNCERYWWSTALFIQNYVNPTSLCFPHSWYLSADLHLFVISPFVVYLIHRYKMKAIYGLLIVILGCVGFTFALHVIYDMSHMFSPRKYDLDHYPTHSRLSSWLIGVMAGYFFVEFPQRSINIPKRLNLCGWTVSLVLMAIAIFGFHPFYQFTNLTTTALQYGLYDALSHVIWSAPICYIIFACAYNSGGSINWLLSHPFWQPISKLSFTIYLLHYPVSYLTVASIKTLPYFNEVTLVQSIFGNTGISILVAIPMTLAFDLPIDTLDKLILSSGRPKSPPKSKKVVPPKTNAPMALKKPKVHFAL